MQSSFAVAGWALDAGAAAGIGVDTVHVWAFPTSGAARNLPRRRVGRASPVRTSRAYLGDGRFTPSGFGLSATLPPGVYDVRAYAFSPSPARFNNSATTRITVTQPELAAADVRGSARRRTRRSPRTSALPAGRIDQASGIRTWRRGDPRWAYPTHGGAPIFVGASGIGYTRPDVGNYFGARFAPPGFYVSGTLPPR